MCRELTKLHEEVRRGEAGVLAEHYQREGVRGEVVLVCGAAVHSSARLDEARAALRQLVEAGARGRVAAAAVARLTGVRANELYGELVRDRREGARGGGG